MFFVCSPDFIWDLESAVVQDHKYLLLYALVEEGASSAWEDAEDGGEEGLSAGAGSVGTAVACASLPGLGGPWWFRGSTAEPGEEAKLRLWLIWQRWDPRVLRLCACKESTTGFKSIRVLTGEKRNSVTEIILKTAGFRVNVLSNLWDSGKHHFHGWKRKSRDEDVLESD